jgi:hypothetical protein
LNHPLLDKVDGSHDASLGVRVKGKEQRVASQIIVRR